MACLAAFLAHDDALPQPDNVPAMLVVDFLCTCLTLSSPQDDTVVLDSPPATEDDLVTGVGVSDVDETFGRFEAVGVEIGECLGETGLLEEVEWRYVLDIVEGHPYFYFRGYWNISTPGRCWTKYQ